LAGLVGGRFINELPFLILSSFAIGFDAGTFELAGYTGDAGRTNR
jgi:hypothetical protein